MTEREPLPEQEQSKGARIYDSPNPSQDQGLRNLVTLVVISVIVLLVVVGVIVWVVVR